jgi:hypothetical protein
VTVSALLVAGLLLLWMSLTYVTLPSSTGDCRLALFGSNLAQDTRDGFFFAHRFRQPKNGTNRALKKGFVTRKGVGPIGGAVVVPRGPFHERAMTLVHVATGKDSFAVQSALALEKPSNP